MLSSTYTSSRYICPIYRQNLMKYNTYSSFWTIVISLPLKRRICDLFSVAFSSIFLPLFITHTLSFSLTVIVFVSVPSSPFTSSVEFWKPIWAMLPSVADLKQMILSFRNAELQGLLSKFILFSSYMLLLHITSGFFPWMRLAVIMRHECSSSLSSPAISHFSDDNHVTQLKPFRQRAKNAISN